MIRFSRDSLWKQTAAQVYDRVSAEISKAFSLYNKRGADQINPVIMKRWGRAAMSWFSLGDMRKVGA